MKVDPSPLCVNARISELAWVRASSPADLKDFVDVIDEYTGEVLYTIITIQAKSLQSRS